jgi:hypothetical protein
MAKGRFAEARLALPIFSGAYEKSPDAGSSWEEMKARVQSKLRS